MDFCTMRHPYLHTSIVKIFSVPPPHVLFSCYCTLVNRRLGIYLDEIFSRHAHKKKSCQTCLSAMNISPSILGTQTKGRIWLGPQVFLLPLSREQLLFLWDFSQKISMNNHATKSHLLLDRFCVGITGNSAPPLLIRHTVIPNDSGSLHSTTYSLVMCVIKVSRVASLNHPPSCFWGNFRSIP